MFNCAEGRIFNSRGVTRCPLHSTHSGWIKALPIVIPPRTSFSPDDSYREMLSRYDTDGAIIIRDLVDSGTISEMRQAVIEHARKTSPLIAISRFTN